MCVLCTSCHGIKACIIVVVGSLEIQALERQLVLEACLASSLGEVPLGTLGVASLAASAKHTNHGSLKHPASHINQATCVGACIYQRCRLNAGAFL